jgi:hypothetical protein
VLQYIAMEIEPLLKHVTPETALGKQFLSETAPCCGTTGTVSLRRPETSGM